MNDTRRAERLTRLLAEVRAMRRSCEAMLEDACQLRNGFASEQIRAEMRSVMTSISDHEGDDAIMAAEIIGPLVGELWGLRREVDRWRALADALGAIDRDQEHDG